METFFSQLEPKFPSVSGKQDINMDDLLKAAKKLVPFFDLLGTAFKPVKSDIDGNIVKLQKKFDKNPEKYLSMYTMLEEEVNEKTTQKKDSAVTSMLWLRRALEFILVFLQLIIEDHREGRKSENLVPFCKQAYESTLKPYHGWIIQKIVPVITHATPWRRDFIKTVALGKDNMEEKVIADISEFSAVLADNVDVIKCTYQLLDIDYQYKV